MWSTGKLLNRCGNADIFLPLKRAVAFREIKLASVFSHFVFPGLRLERITMFQAPWVPGTGDLSLQTLSRNLSVSALLQGLLPNWDPPRERLPFQGERRNFKISGVHCSVSPQAWYNNTIEFPRRSSDRYHSSTYHWARRKRRFSLPRVRAIRN